MPTLPKRIWKPAAFAVLLCGIFAGLILVPELDAQVVEDAVHRFGPVAIVILVALGIVVSPIPSGAIALVAGALYGTVLGGALTILGAGLGAACAFGLSRCFGRGRLVASQTSVARFLTRGRSQQALMMTVFLTRLVPFISFDAVSYVAGLTPLRFWRFLVATLFGTAPVCMAFAAAGNTASSNQMHPAMLALVCGVTLLLPLCICIGRVLRRPRRQGSQVKTARKGSPSRAGHRGASPVICTSFGLL
ncbi:MAG: TVP38/TMEM64 family protein [Pseudomonadota bacterium]